MALPQSPLIIGVGATGVKVAHKIYTRWEQHEQKLGVIGVGFEPPPDGFQDKYVRLNSVPTTVLEKLIVEPQPHIDMWLDAQWELTTYRQTGLITRPLERLMWVDDLARGSRSTVYKRWEREFRSQPDEQIVVYLIGNLGEAGGSSLMLDATVLTRALAEDLGKDVIIWGYTLFPASNASLDVSIRAAAALKEIERLMVFAPEKPFGHPFFYRSLAQAQASLNPTIWNARLNTRLFDLWYGFDTINLEQVMDSIAATINASLIENIYSELVSHRINVAAQTRGDTARINTENARSVVLPTRHFQIIWTHELTLETVKILRRASFNERQLNQEVERFWQGFPSGLEKSFLASDGKLAFARPTIKLAEQFDEFLFPLTSVLPILGREDSQKLRSVPSPLPRLPGAEALTKAIDECEGMITRFRQPAEWQEGIPETAYSKLTAESVRWHGEVFTEHLSQVLEQVLNRDGIGGAQAFLGRLHQILSQGRAAFKGVSVPTIAEHTRQYEDFSKSVKSARRVSDTKPKTPLWRFTPQHGGSLKDATLDVQRYASNLLAGLRVRALKSALENVLAEQVSVVELYQRNLVQWSNIFEDWESTYRQSSALIQKDAFKDELTLAEDLDVWVMNQRQNYLQRAADQDSLPSSQISWKLMSDGQYAPQLKSIPLTESSQLMAASEAVFTEAERQMTIMAFWRAHNNPSLLASMVNHLRSAEIPLLATDSSAHTTEESHSAERLRLIVPVLESRDERELFSFLEHEIRRVHQLGEQDSQMLQIRQHDSAFSITYLWSLEQLNLATEVLAYRQLMALYHQYPTENEHQHVLAADRQIALLESQLDKILISAEIGHVLDDPDQFVLFWLGYQLGIISLSVPQSLGQNVGRRAIYSLHTANESLDLNHDDTPADELLLEAIKTFVFHQRPVIGHQFANNPIPRDEYQHHIRQCLDAAVTQQLETGFGDVADAQVKDWANRAAQPSVLPSVRQSALALLGESVLMSQYAKELRQKASEEKLTLAHDLYSIAAVLLQNRGTKARTQVQQILGSLFSNW